MSPLQPNPFDTPKAAYFSTEEILQLYVDTKSNNEEIVNRILEPRSLLPLRLLGAKGSGKTHLLRYCSFPVRIQKYDNDPIAAITADKFIGLYVDSGALNPQKFSGKGLSGSTWQSIFSFYFELWLVHHFLEVIKVIVDTSSRQEYFDEVAFIFETNKYFSTNVSANFQDINELIQYFTTLRKDVDHRCNNAALRETFDDLVIVFSPGDLIFGIAEAFEKACGAPNKTPILYMIDEAENFNLDQQTFINSLIRFRKGNVTFKIGARLYGIRTNETSQDGEPIKLGSEYGEVSLDNYLENLSEKDYSDFATKLVSRRLELAGISFDGSSKKELSSQFQVVSSSSDYSEECLSLLHSSDSNNRLRPYFEKFSKVLRNNAKMSEETTHEIVGLLRCDASPLVEKASILLFYRSGKADETAALETARTISKSAAAYLVDDKQDGKPHEKVLNHFKLDLLAQLYRDVQQPLAYGGFDTILALSQRTPRNLLMLLKHIYRRSLFAGENPFEGGCISKKSQSDGIKDGAQWFWEDAQPDINATSVRLSVEAVAILFRTVRYSPKPSECALSCFSVLERDLSENSRATLKTAENWSYLIKTQDGGSDKNSHNRRTKYRISSMLAPKWEISHSKRGTIELDAGLCNAIFDENQRKGLADSFKKKTEPMQESKIFDLKDISQGKLL